MISAENKTTLKVKLLWVLAILGVGFLLFWGIKFLVYQSGPTNLYYNRMTGTFLKLSPTGITTISDSDKIIYSDNFNGSQLKMVSADIGPVLASRYGNYNICFPIMFFSRNQKGGYDLIYSSEILLQTKHNFFVIYLLREQAKSEIQKAVSNLPKDSISADQAILPVPDKRFLTVIDFLNEGNHTKAKKLFDPLLTKYPDDLFANILALDFLSGAGDEEGLRIALKNFQTKFPSNGTDLIDYTIKSHELSLIVLQSLREDTNSPARNTNPNYSSSAERKYEHLEYTQVPVYTRNGLSVLLTDYSNGPNFLDHQTFSKVSIIEGEFFLMNGKTDEAQILGNKLLRMGTGLAGTSENLIGRLIGVAVIAISMELNSHVYLSAYQDEKLLSTAFKDLDLNYTEFLNAINKEPIELHPAYGATVPDGFPNYSEATTRGLTGLAQLANLHTATSLRHFYLKHDSWPTDGSSGELIPTPDIDPFSPKQSPLFILAKGNDQIVYSIGPDLTDQQAMIEYDPTNGTTSSGDITRTVYRDRQFGFPNTTKAYASREDLLNDYPNGLPKDPFADTRGMSLKITDTIPPIVWSFGPDADQVDYFTGNSQNSQTAQADGFSGYGGYSSSPLIDVSQKSPKPLPGYSSAQLINGEWVNFPYTGQQPIYDPTNGTISKGDLILKLN